MMEFEKLSKNETNSELKNTLREPTNGFASTKSFNSMVRESDFQVVPVLEYLHFPQLDFGSSIGFLTLSFNVPDRGHCQSSSDLLEHLKQH